MDLHTMDMHTVYSLILVAVLIVAAIAVVAWSRAQQRRKQSLRLQQRFGPEYVRTMNELGDRGKAEAELKDREQRVARLTIIPLTAADAARFRQAWSSVQNRFIDNPKAAVVQADRLVYDLMAARGYPMGDFERRAADISVDHPTVVSNYRAARAIALSDERGQADTEELRKAVVHYRELFRELLEIDEPAQATTVRELATRRVPA
jgi:hypothetical protein